MAVRHFCQCHKLKFSILCPILYHHEEVISNSPWPYFLATKRSRMTCSFLRWQVSKRERVCPWIAEATTILTTKVFFKTLLTRLSSLKKVGEVKRWRLESNTFLKEILWTNFSNFKQTCILEVWQTIFFFSYLCYSPLFSFGIW